MATFMSGNGLKGFAELEQRLAQLANEASATKMGVSATRKAAKVVQEAIIAAAPDGPKAEGDSDGKRGAHAKIKEHIRVKKGRGRTPNTAVMLVHTGDAYHALFQERGTIHIAPRPFMGPAFARSKDAALATMSSELERLLDRAARTGTSGASDTGGDA